jgi:heme-degrading monooxygenase HmoA
LYARSTSIRGNPDDIGKGLTYLREEVLPRISQSEGCVGLSVLADHDGGRCIVATAWADEQAMRATTQEDRTVQERLVQTLGGHSADVHQWEIAIVHRDRPAGDGAGAQVTWARVPTNHVDELLDAYRINLMPKLQELPGFCSLSMLVDRKQGRTVSVTSFETREALGLVRRHARSLREQFARAMGAKIVDVAEMDLALAHLRVPETV